MRAGQLRHQVTIQTRTTTVDDIGQPVESWADTETVWASVEPLQGRELESGQAVHAETTHRITMRYLAVLSTTDRLQFGSRYFEILSVINTDERNIQLVLLCKEWT